MVTGNIIASDHRKQQNPLMLLANNSMQTFRTEKNLCPNGRATLEVIVPQMMPGDVIFFFLQVLIICLFLRVLEGALCTQQ